jgi:hypothetical protein
MARRSTFAGLGGRLQWRDGRLNVLDPVCAVFARISFGGNAR